MGSHFFKFLKVDQKFLDLVCPAAGYDNTPPPPEIYCPANNYYLPSEPIFSDEGMPELTPPVEGSDDEIIFIISNQIGLPFEWNFTRSSGNYSWEIYGKNDVLIDSGAQSTNKFSYNFFNLAGGYEGAGDIRYFRVHFKCVNSGEYFLTCTAASAITYSLVKAYMNTPLITSFGFGQQLLLQEFWACETMDECNALNVFLNTINLQKVTLPVSMAFQQNFNNWFQNSSIPEAVLPANAPACTEFKNTIDGAKIQKITLPNKVHDSPPSGYISFLQFARNTQFLKKLTIPDFSDEKKIDIQYAFQNSLIEDIEFHPNILIYNMSNAFNDAIFFKKKTGIFEIHNSEFIFNITSLSNVYNNNLFIKKIKIINNFQHLDMVSNANCVIEEIEYPEEITITRGSLPTPMPTLKKVVMPLTVIGYPDQSYFPYDYLRAANIVEITKTTDWGVTKFTNAFRMANSCKIFDQPGVIFAHTGTTTSGGITCSGTSSTPRSLEYFDINWSESVTQGLKSINLAYNNLSKTEIERIFTALPVVSGTYNIRINNNPGSVAADGTIASNKGWTVTK